MRGEWMNANGGGKEEGGDGCGPVVGDDVDCIA